MYRASSPYAQAAPLNYAAPQNSYSPPANAIGTVQPGDATYTQVIGPDGRLAYQLFRAVPASFHTANGIINGMQWMPSETVSSPPPGSRPATADFVASWLRNSNVTAAPSTKESQSKEKESSKHGGHSRHASDYEMLHKAREKDAHNRRSSYNAPVAAPAAVTFPTGSTGYPVAPATYGSPYASYGDPNLPAAPPYGYPPGPYGVPSVGGYPDLTRQLNSMDLGRNEGTKERERKVSEKRSRKQSTHEQNRPNDPYANYSSPYSQPGGGYPAPGVPYAVPYPAAGSVHSTNPSPNVPPAEIPYGSGYPPAGYPVPYASSSGRNRANSTAARSTTPLGHSTGNEVYPPGHIMEGQSKQSQPIAAPRSRAASPNPNLPNQAAYSQAVSRPPSRKGGPSPHPSNSALPAHQLAAPDAFSRPINAGLPYLPFKSTKIHDLDEFFSQLPKMPPALESHDVRNEDWFRFMEDITLAWTGRLPTGPRTDGQPPRPSILAAELIHTWNSSFFEARGIEIVLYKGPQRRSGRLYGRVDLENADESDSSSSESSSSESDDPYPPPSQSNTPSGWGGSTYPDDLAAARRRYYEGRTQEKQRRRDRRKRRRERRRNRKYTVYATCAREGGPRAPAQTIIPNMPVASSYPGMQPMPPPGPPPGKVKSHGRGPSGKY